MANTYTLINSATVGSGGASDISFTSIPSTYTDLLIKLSTRDSRSSNPYNEVSVTFNGSGTYSRITIYGTGSANGSETDTTGKWVYSDTTNATSSTFSNAEIYIPNYAGSNVKSISADSVTENNSSTGNTVVLAAGIGTTTSAITSITLTPNLSNTFLEYSTAYLYGISNS